MNEEEKAGFWGDLVEPITSLLGGLAVRGEDKLYKVVLAIIDKAENAALDEREAVARLTSLQRQLIDAGALESDPAGLKARQE